MGLTGDSESSSVDNTATDRNFGLTMGLSSHPSRFFNQSHNISYYKSTSEDLDSNGVNYNGSLSYLISKKMSTSLSFAVTKAFSESSTGSDDSIGVNIGSSFSYMLTKHFSTNESLRVDYSQSSSSLEGTSNLSDRKLLTAVSNLRYRRLFSFLSFSASYGTGYTADSDIALDTADNGGQAITHNGSIDFNRIDFTRFFFFNAGGNFSRVLKNTSGTVNENLSHYYASFSNRFWKKYFSMDGNYDRDFHKVAVQAIVDKNEQTALKFLLTPIERLQLSVDLHRSVAFNDFAGFSNTNSMHVSSGYGHRLFGGSLSGNVSFSYQENNFTGGSDITRNKNFRLSYERTMLRRVLWHFDATRNESNIEDVHSNIMIFTDTLFYRLRAWTMSLTHMYSIDQDSARDFRENKIFFKIGRQFVRAF